MKGKYWKSKFKFSQNHVVCWSEKVLRKKHFKIVFWTFPSRSTKIRYLLIVFWQNSAWNCSLTQELNTNLRQLESRFVSSSQVLQRPHCADEEANETLNLCSPLWFKQVLKCSALLFKVVRLQSCLVLCLYVSCLCHFKNFCKSTFPLKGNKVWPLVEPLSYFIFCLLALCHSSAYDSFFCL